MNVLHTISGLGAESGGPSICVRDLLDGLSNIGAPARLLTFAPKLPGLKQHGHDRPWLITIPNDCHGALSFSRNMRAALAQSECDLYHCHALWRYVNHITCKIARQKRKPYVLTPHGMLYPSALRLKRWRKKAMLALWFRRDIMQATCLHVTCKQELEHCRNYGYTGPIALIPNPIVLPDSPPTPSAKPAIRTIGYLGRLHPIKKIENLIRGAALARQNGCAPFCLLIMGSGETAYEAALHRQVAALGLEECVHFTGFVDGTEKYTRLASLHALMLPSEQENFGMVVPEALLCCTPVYASLGTPWSELNSHTCGWWRSNSPESIAEVLSTITTLPEEELQAMGAAGRKLVESRYTQQKVAQMMQQLYNWLICHTDKPEFVYIK